MKDFKCFRVSFASYVLKKTILILRALKLMSLGYINLQWCFILRKINFED